MRPTPEEVFPSVQEFLDAWMPPEGSWDKTYAVLVRHQGLLLSDAADATIGKMIEMMASNNEGYPPDVLKFVLDTFEKHRQLLRRCRVIGIPAAWAEFRRR